METVTVKQIHSAFDLESDALLVMPEDNFPEKEKIEGKAERLKKLGFRRCSEVGALERFDKDREVYLKSLEEQRTVHEFAKKYRAKYPDLKFITKKQLNEICRKYNLVAKQVSEYVGDIPDQKLSEMEYWLDEIDDVDMPDCIYEYLLFTEVVDGKKSNPMGMFSMVRSAQLQFTHLEKIRHRHKGRTPLSESEILEVFRNNGVPEKQLLMSNIVSGKISSPGLVIAAPESMFRKPQKNLDPVVLQPVNGGYLVIAKWGEEANDPALTVPELN
jgi:hypothetical protein